MKHLAIVFMLVLAGCSFPRRAPVSSVPYPMVSSIAAPSKTLMLSWHGYSEVNLAWDPSPSTNVVRYNLYYGAKSGEYTNCSSAGSNLFFLVSGLNQFETYYFAATALDTLGLESDFSDELKLSGFAGFSIVPFRDEGEPTGKAFEIWFSRDAVHWEFLDITDRTNYPFYCDGESGFFRVKIRP